MDFIQEIIEAVLSEIDPNCIKENMEVEITDNNTIRKKIKDIICINAVKEN